MGKLNKKAIVYPLTLVVFASALMSCTTGTSTGSGTSSSTSDSTSDSSSVSSGSTSSDSSSTHVSEVVVAKKQNSIEIKDRNVEGYDWTTLFTVTVDGDEIPVTEAMIDASEVVAAQGLYSVVCTYEGKTASVIVNVSKTDYVVQARVTSVDVKVMDVANYDFDALFTATMDGESVEIVDSMVTSTVTGAVGEYTYTVTLGEASASVTVNVVEDHQITVLPAYNNYIVRLDERGGVDLTSLFSLYVDGVATKVEESNITLSKPLLEVGVDESTTATFAITLDSSSATASVNITVIADEAVALSSKSAVLSPNAVATDLDLTSLFEVRVDGELVPVTKEMIQGDVKFGEVGDYEIYCYYMRSFAVATVSIKTGVQYSYTKSSVVNVKVGTDKATYNFAGDILVTINGIAVAIDNSYFDVSAVDFTTSGKYSAVAEIPYYESSSATPTGVARITIDYLVTTETLSVDVLQSSVSVEYGSNFDPLANVIVKKGGTVQLPLTSDPALGNDPTYCYAEIVDNIDTSVVGEQTVILRVYNYGMDEEPTIVSYKAVVTSNIKFESVKTLSVFSGTTIDYKSFFKVTDGVDEVTITDDMILGKVDTLTPGEYALSVTYEGQSQTFIVVVLDSDIVGTYVSAMADEPPTASTDDDGDESGYSLDSYALDAGKSISMEVKADGTGTVILPNDSDGRPQVFLLTDLVGTSGSTAQFKLGTFNYKLSFNNGILFVETINANKMAYSNSNRFYLFFQTSKYEVEDSFTINSGASSMLNMGSSGGYSIDVFKVKDIAAGTSTYYGLKSILVEKNGSDSYLASEWGEVTLTGELPFVVSTDDNIVTYTITMNGTPYTFKMLSATVGTCNLGAASEHPAAFTGTYTGMLDGQAATLVADNYDGCTLTIDSTSTVVFNYSGSNIREMNACDYENNIVFIKNDANNHIYKLQLYLEDHTFEVLELDGYEGKYLSSNGYVFLDGQGGGYFKPDNSSYSSRIALTYNVVDGKIETKFVGVKPTYAYGTYATFYIDVFGNSLVLADSDSTTIIGVKFESEIVRNGLSVSLSQYTVDQLENADDTKAALTSYFTITTPDGVVSEEDKANYIDFNRVDFTKPSFYLVTVDAMIGENLYTKYFTIQIVAAKYEDHILVGNYTAAYGNGSYSLSIDKFGNATYYHNSTSSFYRGQVVINGDNSFVFEGALSTNATRTARIEGALTVDGIVSVRVYNTSTAGSTSTLFISSFYETSKYEYKWSRYNWVHVFYTFVSKTGGSDYVLYATDYDDDVALSLVNHEILNDLGLQSTGVIIKVTNDAGLEVEAKVNSWGGNGLQMKDVYAGDYAAGGDDVTLDGYGISATNRGIATYNDSIYEYYMYSSDLIAFYHLGESTPFSYERLNLATHRITTLNAYELGDFVGTYRMSSYTSVSSDTELTVNSDGTATYKISYESGYSTTSSTFYGYVIKTATGYQFSGSYRSSASGAPNLERNITSVITNLGGKAFQVVTSGYSSVEGTTYLVPSDSRCTYVGNSYSNYVVRYSYTSFGGGEVYLLYLNSSATPEFVNVEIMNDVAFGTAGSLFKVTDASGAVRIELAKFNTANSTGNGYIVASEFRGSYSPIEGADYYGILTLDGFAYSSLEGDAILSAGGVSYTGTYIHYYDNIVSVTANENEVTRMLRVDTTAKTYEFLSDDSSVDAALAGTYYRVNPSASTPVGLNNGIVELNSFGYGSYGNSVGSVTYDSTNHTFTINNARNYGGNGNETYSGALISDGVISFTSGNNSWIYVRADLVNGVVFFGGQSSSSNLIWRVNDGVELKYYMMATSSRVTYGLVDLTLGSDSPAELGAVGCIFDVRKDGVLIFAAKIRTQNNTSGFTAANVAERGTYTGSLGALFTDGFTTSATARGVATLGETAYTYYYNPALTDTVVLYDADGNIVNYLVISGTTYTPKASVLAEYTELIFETTYGIGTSKTSYSVTLDEYGYVTVVNSGTSYVGEVTSYDPATHTLNFDATNPASPTRQITGTIQLRDGIYYEVNYTGYTSVTGGMYANFSDTYLVVGSAWYNLVYRVMIDGEYTYFYRYERDKLDDKLGMVDVVSRVQGVDFGTVGAVFSVYTKDGTYIFTGYYNTTSSSGSGYSGYNAVTSTDGLEGTYTITDSTSSLVLDGYGLVKDSDGAVVGYYSSVMSISSGVIAVTSTDGTTVNYSIRNGTATITE